MSRRQARASRGSRHSVNDDDDRLSVSTQDTRFDDDMAIDSEGFQIYVEDEPFDMTVLFRMNEVQCNTINSN